MFVVRVPLYVVMSQVTNGRAHAFNVKVQCKMLKDCVINGASYALAANFRG